MWTKQFGSWWHNFLLTWIFMSHFILEWGLLFDSVGHPWSAGIYIRTLAPPNPAPRRLDLRKKPKKKRNADLKWENDPFVHWERVQKFENVTIYSSVFQRLSVGPTWVTRSFTAQPYSREGQECVCLCTWNYGISLASQANAAASRPKMLNSASRSGQTPFSFKASWSQISCLIKMI